MPTLIDIGANLTHDSFDHDRDDVIRRAHDAGVERMIITGATGNGSIEASQLATEYPEQLYSTAGVHPHHASEYDEPTDLILRELIELDHVVAVGECGLDYFRNFSPVDAQKAAFIAQLNIATDCLKPVFLHQRDAHDDFIAILKEHYIGQSGLDGVAHCFTGGPEEMQAYLELGLHIGVTGWICDERRGADLQEAVRDLPLDRVLIETDAPYLMPRDLPEKLPARRNEPVVLPHVLNSLAGFMNCDADELAAASTRNTERLFRLRAA